MKLKKTTHAFVLSMALGLASFSTTSSASAYTASEAEADIAAVISQLPIDGAPNIGAVEVTDDIVTASDISFRFPEPFAITVSIGGLTTTNLRAVNGDEFMADGMTIEDFNIVADIEDSNFAYSMDKIIIDQLGGLQKLIPDFDENNPLTTIMEVANIFASLSLGSMTVDTYTVSSQADDVSFTEVINDYKLINLQNGKLELASTGPVQVIVTFEGDQTALITVDSMSVSNTDYGILGVLFSEQDGERDGTVLPVMEDMTMNGMRAILPDNAGQITIGSMRMSNIWMRQLPVSLATLNAAITDPASLGEIMPMFQSPKFIIDITRSYGLGLIEVNDFDMKIPKEGINITLERVAYGGSANGEDRLAEIAIQGVTAQIPEESISLRLEAALVKGFDYTGLLDSAAKARALDKFIPESLPSLELMQIKGLEINGPDGINISLANYELEIGESVGLMPTLIRLGVESFKMPSALVDDRDAQEMLTALGIENIDLSYETRLDWDVAAKIISLSNSRISLADAGEINLEASLGGIEKEMFMGEPDPEQLMGMVALRSMAISYEDNSLFDRLVAFAAEQMGGTPEDLKGMMKLQSGMILGQFGESEGLTKLSNAIASFVDNPGKLSISVNPDEPQLLAELMGLAMIDPAMIAEVLKLDAVASSN